jgi:hypothetical protein
MRSIRMRNCVSRALVLLAFVSVQTLAEVTSLVVDPLSTSTVYAGASEGGVSKSTDAGATWTRAGLADTPVFALAMDPGAPSVLYAITSSGLLKSSNGGQTWSATALTNGSTPTWGMIERPMSWSVITLALARRADPALPAKVYAGVTYAASDWYTDYVWGDVSTSTDGGETWTNYVPDATDPFYSPWMSAPALAAAAQTDTTPATLYTSYTPGINDYQVCWIRDGTLSGCARLDQSPEGPTVLVVDPRNPHVLYAGMNGSGVYKSTDAGATWSGGGSGVVRALVLDPLAEATLYAVTDDQGVLKSTDGGAIWTGVNAGLEPGVRALAIDPLTPAVLYAAAASGVFKSIDGGASWNPTGLMQRLQSVNVPLGLIGGTAGTGTVTLNAPAGAGGAVVALSSSNPALASVAASVTVPAGETSGSFPISTVAVTESSVQTISANLDGLGKSAQLMVGPPIAYMMISRWPVVGGMAVSGYVVLGVPAPTDGATIALTSSHPAVATVPATTTAPAGAWFVNFPIATTVVSADAIVTFSATYAGETHHMVIRVVPAAVSELSLNPQRVFGGSTATGTVTLITPAPPGGAVVNLFSGNTSVATVPATVTVPAGGTSASFTVSTNTVLPPTYSQIGISIMASAGGASASQTLSVALPGATLSSLTLNPPSMAGGSAGVGTVFLSMGAPAGGATIALSSSNLAAATVPASVTVPAFATSANFPVSTSAVSAATTATISAVYGADTRSMVLHVVPGTLSSLSLNPASLSAGSASSGTVTLSMPAPAGGATVSLTSSNPAVASVAASVMVASGAVSATFPVSTVACTPGSATVSGTYGGVSKSAALTVTSTADNVTMQVADYFAGRDELRVAAKSTGSAATLQVHVTSSQELIGTMENLGDGKYSGRFTWSVNPQSITVRSGLCGSATTVVRNKV